MNPLNYFQQKHFDFRFFFTLFKPHFDFGMAREPFRFNFGAKELKKNLNNENYEEE